MWFVFFNTNAYNRVPEATEIIKFYGPSDDLGTLMHDYSIVWWLTRFTTGAAAEAAESYGFAVRRNTS